MSRIMLIDAAHAEETRVAVMDGNRLEELDFESAAKRQLRGNVYLARVTRVEPSLQAAFVEYGGNRHGFLAFSEIHADYYQIPIEDRKALLEAEEEESKMEAEEEAEETEADDADETKAEASPDDELPDDDSDDDNDDETGIIEEITDDADEEVEEEQEKMLGARRKSIAKRRYKIQEVIKRGQILLVQAVKEERGNKGAAMTTYLSLAGRYCVLMPNTPRGGGISRKISNGKDRKRLKQVMSELSVPQGMGLIVRTAGAKRTKAEIKRDYIYLSKLWDTIRDTTLKSIAPALIHEEGNLVKRSIRDLYGKGIDKVLVQGEEAYKTAKNFMKLLMPSHAKNVRHYKDEIPLFLRYQVEKQIEACLEPIAQLKSGGYLVIHPTEALVSVDVNSGRSTKERNVERTALKTNLEAAEEVARQMRLRDLAGLVVIDFIDMEHSRNNKAVERKMREVLAQDRARVQAGRISQFGLMELSRQRRRRSLLEGSTASCEHCGGVGRRRSIASSALKTVRAIEEEAIRGRYSHIRVKTTPEVAAYLLNEKRNMLNGIEKSTGQFAEIIADASLVRPDFVIEGMVKRENAGPDPLEEIAREFNKTKPGKKRGRKKEPAEKNDANNANDEILAESTSQEEPGDTRPKRKRGRRGGKNRRDSKAGAETSVMQDEEIAEKTDKAAGKKTAKKTVGKNSRKTKRAENSGDEPAKDNSKKSSAKSTAKTGARKTSDKKTSGKKTSDKKPAAKKPAKTSASKEKQPATKAADNTGEKPVTANGADLPPEPEQKPDKTEDIAAKAEKPKKPRRRGWWQRRR